MELRFCGNSPLDFQPPCASDSAMSKNILVLDLETKRTFEEVGSRDNFGALGVSVVGVYSYITGEYHAFWEDDFPKLEGWLNERPLVVGFNQRKFDMAVLQPHMKCDLSALPMIDIMEEMAKVLGHRIGLDSVAQATLGAGKTGHGLDAIHYWNTKQLDKLSQYCLDDVRLTKELFEYGAKHQELFFMSKFGNNKMKAAVSWKVEHPKENAQEAAQFSLF